MMEFLANISVLALLAFLALIVMGVTP